MGSGASRRRTASAAPANSAGQDQTDAARSLGRIFQSGGINKVILIRHANAKPRDQAAAAVEAGSVFKPGTPFGNSWTIGDLTRPLTEEGEQQAGRSAAVRWARLARAR